jgi:hypothetical protein
LALDFFGIEWNLLGDGMNDALNPRLMIEDCTGVGHALATHQYLDENSLTGVVRAPDGAFVVNGKEHVFRGMPCTITI